MLSMSECSRGTGQAERYRTLLEINNALVANLTRDDLFRAIARALRRVVPFDRMEKLGIKRPRHGIS